MVLIKDEDSDSNDVFEEGEKTTCSKSFVCLLTMIKVVFMLQNNLKQREKNRNVSVK